MSSCCKRESIILGGEGKWGQTRFGVIRIEGILLHPRGARERGAGERGPRREWGAGRRERGEGGFRSWCNGNVSTTILQHCRSDR